MDQRIIHDAESPPENLFQCETAGFTAHPAEAIVGNSNNDESIIEWMGVTDPKCSQIPGRVFKASAIRNLSANIPDGTPIPDLVIQRGQDAICEYKNPLLFPGMFPMLFPLGIGGFEHSE